LAGARSWRRCFSSEAAGRSRSECARGRNGSERRPIMNILTPRELDVLRLLASGCSYWQAAMRLGISPHTVVSHVKNAYRKLDVHTAASAVMRAVELGLLATPTIR